MEYFLIDDVVIRLDFGGRKKCALNGEVFVSIQGLGSLGEILAAAATIVTLIYLSMQIKLNNRLAVSTIENQLNSREYERRFAIAMDPASRTNAFPDGRNHTDRPKARCPDDRPRGLPLMHSLGESTALKPAGP